MTFASLDHRSCVAISPNFDYIAMGFNILNYEFTSQLVEPEFAENFSSFLKNYSIGMIEEMHFLTSKDFQEEESRLLGIAPGLSQFILKGSSKYVDLFKDMEKTEKILFRVEKKIKYWEISLRNNSFLKKASFKKAIGELPKNFEPNTENSFFDFFDKYGTHFIKKVVLGGKVLKEYLLSKAYLKYKGNYFQMPSEDFKKKFKFDLK